MKTKHTPGPWTNPLKTAAHYSVWKGDTQIASCRWSDRDNPDIVSTFCVQDDAEAVANACLIAAAPTQHAEMLRYLPVLERAEADPEIWARLTDGLGIATLNGYRAALAKAKGEA